VAGAHSRSSRRDRSHAVEDLEPTRRDPEGSDPDRDYGEIFRARPADDPAPPSPPIGLPTAFSSSSFRAQSPGHDAGPGLGRAASGRSATLAPPPPAPTAPRPGSGDTGATRTGSGLPGPLPVAPRAPHALSGPQALAVPPAAPARPATPTPRPGGPTGPGRAPGPGGGAPAAPRRPAGPLPPAGPGGRPATPPAAPPGRPVPAGPAPAGPASGAPARSDPTGATARAGAPVRPGARPAGPGTGSAPRPATGPGAGSGPRPTTASAPGALASAPGVPASVPGGPATPPGAPPRPSNGAPARPAPGERPGPAKPSHGGPVSPAAGSAAPTGARPVGPPARTPDGTAIAPAVEDASDRADREHVDRSGDAGAQPTGSTTTTARPTSTGSTTTTARPTSTGRRANGVPQSAQTRAERRAAGRDGLTRAAGHSRAGTRSTRPGTRSTARATTRHGADRAAEERPAPPRGRAAAAVASLVVAVAAKVRHWPGGEHVVAAGHWVDEHWQAYLDGKDVASLTAAARLWRRRRRTGYALLATTIGVPLLSVALGWLFISVPNADSAVESQLNTVSFSDGSLLARVAPGEQGNRQKVSIAQIPLPVQRAVLSAEDRTFYTNSGFDIGGIVHAAFKQITGGAGGGSTITQQYVKNAMVGDEHSYFRKFRELIISAKITQEYSKDQVLEDYLNSIYLGRGAYGIQAASQAYFNKSVEQLTPAEGAMIAGLIQAPSQWDPAVNLEGSQRRWNYVMEGMVSSGWLSPADRAAAHFPTVAPPRKAVNGVPDDARGHIYSAVKDELGTLGIDEDALVTEGLQIQTTIDPKAQQEAIDAVHEEMKGKPANLRTAAVSVDPRTGDVLSYFGGDNGAGLDYAQVSKQAGSTFKPFVMLAALEHDPPIGISTQFNGQQIPGRTVRNVEGADCSSCSLKQAMTLSNNVVFTALGNEVGPQAVANAAHQAGIGAKLDNPNSGIALGNVEVTPLEMAGAYATFANDGIYQKPHLVQKVTTASGEVLYDHAAPQGEPRVDPKVARNVTEAMSDVPTYDGASLSGGRPAVGKTGTVQSHVENQNNDAWMVGYTPSLVASVWVGTDDNTPIQYGDGRPIYGHGIPSDIWQKFMDGATQGTPKQTFGQFVPVAGTDPGETATGEGQQAGTTSASPTTTSKPSRDPAATTKPSAGATPTSAPAVPTPAVPPAAATPAPAPAPAAAPPAVQAPAEAPADEPATG
jgi:membrane peptidoglycan carboxypeptidase